jgi:hypothetical protein
VIPNLSHWWSQVVILALKLKKYLGTLVKKKIETQVKKKGNSMTRVKKEHRPSELLLKNYGTFRVKILTTPLISLIYLNDSYRKAIKLY